MRAARAYCLVAFFGEIGEELQTGAKRPLLQPCSPQRSSSSPWHGCRSHPRQHGLCTRRTEEPAGTPWFRLRASILLACVAAVNAQRLATAVYWRDMALTTACEVLSLLAPRHFLGAVVASTATGAAIACGRGGLALRAGVALAVAYAAAPATTDAADVKR